MKIIYKILALGCSSLSLFASSDEPKQTLQSSYLVNYKILPSQANSLSDIITEGMVYGRLRSNWFFHQYQNDSLIIDGKVVKNHNILGLGSSLMYKTAPYAGLSATAGLYYTSAGTGIDNPSRADLLKSGKDVYSRYNLANGNGSSYAVLGQAYLQYEYESFKVKAGREIFNSFFTKSNDSKMIPNTFEGITIETKDIEKTRLRAAYLTRQKLRDHSTFHSTLMYDDRTDAESGVTQANWNENDDSAVHKGLNYSNFKVAGINKNPGLAVIDGYSKALFTDDLKVSASGLYLKDLFYTAMLELNYKFDLGGGYILTPGVRYVQQFDNGAGKIGGASLSGKAAASTASTNPDRQVDAQTRAAYTNPDSVDAKMIAARLVLNKGASSLALGYTKIADEADFITPWRGFITSGYTREMARYNWISNTRTYRLRGSYDFGKANLVNGLRTYASYTYEDYDEDKLPGKFDSYLYYVGLIKTFESVPNLSFRFRAQWVDAVDSQLLDNGQTRLELNYLF